MTTTQDHSIQPFLPPNLVHGTSAAFFSPAFSRPTLLILLPHTHDPEAGSEKVTVWSAETMQVVQRALVADGEVNRWEGKGGVELMWKGAGKRSEEWGMYI